MKPGPNEKGGHTMRLTISDDNGTVWEQLTYDVPARQLRDAGGDLVSLDSSTVRSASLVERIRTAGPRVEPTQTMQARCSGGVRSIVGIDGVLMHCLAPDWEPCDHVTDQKGQPCST